MSWMKRFPKIIRSFLPKRMFGSQRKFRKIHQVQWMDKPMVTRMKRSMSKSFLPQWFHLLHRCPPRLMQPLKSSHLRFLSAWRKMSFCGSRLRRIWMSSPSASTISTRPFATKIGVRVPDPLTSCVWSRTTTCLMGSLLPRPSPVLLSMSMQRIWQKFRRKCTKGFLSWKCKWPKKTLSHFPWNRLKTSLVILRGMLKNFAPIQPFLHCWTVSRKFLDHFHHQEKGVSWWKWTSNLRRSSKTNPSAASAGPWPKMKWRRLKNKWTNYWKLVSWRKSHLGIFPNIAAQLFSSKRKTAKANAWLANMCSWIEKPNHMQHIYPIWKPLLRICQGAESSPKWTCVLDFGKLASVSERSSSPPSPSLPGGASGGLVCLSGYKAHLEFSRKWWRCCVPRLKIKWKWSQSWKRDFVGHFSMMWDWGLRMRRSTWFCWKGFCKFAWTIKFESNSANANSWSASWIIWVSTSAGVPGTPPKIGLKPFQKWRWEIWLIWEPSLVVPTFIAAISGISLPRLRGWPTNWKRMLFGAGQMKTKSFWMNSKQKCLTPVCLECLEGMGKSSSFLMPQILGEAVCCFSSKIWSPAKFLKVVEWKD